MPVLHRSMIDPEKLLGLVDQMRLAVPQGVQDAQEVLERREQIVSQSLKDAQRIKAAADTESRIRLDESEMVKEGRKRAEEVIEEAQVKAQRLLEQVQREANNRRAGADQYAKESLHKLEQEISAILGAVQRGLVVLGHEEPEPAPAKAS